MSILDEIIRKTIYSVLMEVIDGNSPDELVFMGDKYEVFVDVSTPLLFYKGEWLHRAETHRDIISLIKFGCEEWELENLYGREKTAIIKNTLDKLWSSNHPFSYPSRIFYAKGKAKEKGVDYILASWDELNESQIREICDELNIDRRKLVYVK